MSAGRSEYIRFAVVDFNGKELSKTVPLRHRDDRVYLYSGALAAGARSECLVVPKEVEAAGCPNRELIPDWSTEHVLPWASGEAVSVRRVFCTQVMAPTPRSCCTRLLEELAAFQGRGLQLLAASELEFTVAKKREDGKLEPMFGGVEIFATLQNSKAADFCYDVERGMHEAGIDIKTMNAEYGWGQLEITFAPKFGIAAPDAACTFRTGVKEIAQRRGLIASFMSRPFGNAGAGNGGHLNFSLWAPEKEPASPAASSAGEGGRSGRVPAPEDWCGGFCVRGLQSAMHSTEDDTGLTPLAQSFLAGVLKHAPAMEAFCSPTPPCYTRHGNWAPTEANWGPDDRFAMVRVKADPKGDAKSCQMELRMPSATACPYLAIAALVAAGLDGLEQGLELAPQRTAQAGNSADKLPTTLEEALQALEADAYMAGKLGADLVRWYCQVKRSEMKKLEEWHKESHAPDMSEACQRMYFEFM